MNGRVGGRAGSGGGASSSGQRGDQPARSVPRGGFTPIPRPRLTRWVSTPSGGRRGGAASPAFASSRADANGDDGDGSKRRGDRQVANVAGGWDAGGTSRPTPSARSRRKAKADKGGKISGTQGSPKAPGGTQDRGGPNSATELRREASAILRALSAARAAPGGLRATLGEEPALISRLLDALCAAGMLYQANALFREALDARVVASPFAVESLVRHGVKAGRAAEVAAAFDAYVAAGGSPTLRTYTDLITPRCPNESSNGAIDEAASASATTRNTTTTPTSTPPPGIEPPTPSISGERSPPLRRTMMRSSPTRRRTPPPSERSWRTGWSPRATRWSGR